MNVAAHLATFAEREPDRAAVIVARTGKTLTFRELHADSDALAAGLVKSGIGSGVRVAVMVPPSLEFFSLVFALFKARAVPVMIDPGMGMRNLGTCLNEAEPAAFIGIAKAHVARRLFGWAKGAITVSVGRSRFFCDHSTHELSSPLPLREGLGEGSSSLQKNPPPAPRCKAREGSIADETAAILFTSGSTGLAKGVGYTHGIFAAQVEMLKTIYNIQPGEVDLCTFPLFALFGPALGMTCIVPTMNFSKPATINAALTFKTIEKYQPTNLFGSPAVIRRLSRLDRPMPTLKRAISAGAPARLHEIERFASLLPNAEVFTPYGATEALPVANIDSNELLGTKPLTESGHGLCIGRPVPGVTVHVVPIRDDAMPVFEPSLCLPQGEIGEIAVRGPIVTKSYWKRPDATRLAKMHDPTTGETLHRMGDVGYFDEHGRLWFCGRKSQRVVTEHGTLFTDQVEPILNTIARTALVGVRINGVMTPLIVAECGPRLLGLFKEYNEANWPEIHKALREKAATNPVTAAIEHYLMYRWTFPMDPRHNSKINREKLALWAARMFEEGRAKAHP